MTIRCSPGERAPFHEYGTRRGPLVVDPPRARQRCRPARPRHRRIARARHGLGPLRRDLARRDDRQLRRAAVVRRGRAGAGHRHAEHGEAHAGDRYRGRARARGTRGFSWRFEQQALGSAAAVACWAATAVTISTVASQTIFGLRKEAQRARVLGQYTLESKIGQGGMGDVWRASHSLLRRPTAVKLLPPSRMGEVAIRRFEREVQLTARLTHPNTVAIYDYGRTRDGIFTTRWSSSKGRTSIDWSRLARASAG